MTRGVKKGKISKRDVLRMWIDSCGDDDIVFEDAKSQYDSITGADPTYTSTEVRKILSETHATRGYGSVWARVRDRSCVEEFAAEAFVRALQEDDMSDPARDRSWIAREILTSWDTPVLVAVINSWNSVNGFSPGDEGWVEVDFRNPAWMKIYSAACDTAGLALGPLATATHFTWQLVELASRESGLGGE